MANHFTINEKRRSIIIGSSVKHLKKIVAEHKKPIKIYKYNNRIILTTIYKYTALLVDVSYYLQLINKALGMIYF